MVIFVMVLHHHLFVIDHVFPCYLHIPDIKITKQRNSKDQSFRRFAKHNLSKFAFMMHGTFELKWGECSRQFFREKG